MAYVHPTGDSFRRGTSWSSSEGHYLNGRSVQRVASPEEERQTYWIIALALCIFCPPAGLIMSGYLLATSP